MSQRNLSRRSHFPSPCLSWLFLFHHRFPSTKCVYKCGSDFLPMFLLEGSFQSTCLQSQLSFPKIILVSLPCCNGCHAYWDHHQINISLMKKNCLSERATYAQANAQVFLSTDVPSSNPLSLWIHLLLQQLIPQQFTIWLSSRQLGSCRPHPAINFYES